MEIREKRAYEWGFGRNKDGELSTGFSKLDSLVPAPSIGLREVATRQIVSSSNHSVLLTSKGQVYTCGSALHGKLGRNATTKCITKFWQVRTLSSYNVRMVACNDYATMCLLDNGALF